MYTMGGVLRSWSSGVDTLVNQLDNHRVGSPTRYRPGGVDARGPHSAAAVLSVGLSIWRSSKWGRFASRMRFASTLMFRPRL